MLLYVKVSYSRFNEDRSKSNKWAYILKKKKNTLTQLPGLSTVLMPSKNQKCLVLWKRAKLGVRC